MDSLEGYLGPAIQWPDGVHDAHPRIWAGLCYEFAGRPNEFAETPAARTIYSAQHAVYNHQPLLLDDNDYWDLAEHCGVN